MAFPDYMHRTETQIMGKVIRRALALGYAVSVNDGEEWTLKQSRDYATITAECAATDMTVLRFRFNGERVGDMMFVHGNHEDVISDYSDNEAMAHLSLFAGGL